MSNKSNDLNPKNEAFKDLHKILKQIDCDTNTINRILKLLESKKLDKREQHLKDQAQSIGFLMIDLLEGYDNHETAKLLQNVVAYLQESEQFLSSEKQFKTVQALQIISNAFLGVEVLLQKDCNEIKDTFSWFLSH